MRKRKKGRKFSLKTDQRTALLRSMVRALFLKEKIETLESRAKEASRLAEKLITRAKKGDLASRRLALRDLSVEIVRKLFSEIAPRYKERSGGYTRIIKLGPRKSDGARMAIIELVK